MYIVITFRILVLCYCLTPPQVRIQGITKHIVNIPNNVKQKPTIFVSRRQDRPCVTPKPIRIKTN